jgi:hypothetical protein
MLGPPLMFCDSRKLLSLILIELKNKQRLMYGSYMDTVLNGVDGCGASRMGKHVT